MIYCSICEREHEGEPCAYPKPETMNEKERTEAEEAMKLQSHPAYDEGYRMGTLAAAKRGEAPSVTVDLKKLRDSLVSTITSMKRNVEIVGDPIIEYWIDGLNASLELLDALEAKVVAPPAPVNGECICDGLSPEGCPAHDQQLRAAASLAPDAKHHLSMPWAWGGVLMCVCGEEFSIAHLQAMGQAHAAPGAKEPKAEGR